MTFQDFLRIFALNLLANTLPLCVCLFATAFLIIKMFEKRIYKVMIEREGLVAELKERSLYVGK